MALHLITGYAGQEHITSNDQAAYNAATFGEGQFVVDRGNKFNATILTNNAIQIADGEALMQGRFIKMPFGTSETVTIDNGTNGKYRNDLICIRYEKSSSSGIENTSLVVIKGEESTSTATDPDYTQGNITDGTDLINDMPLYRVSLNGINISSVTALFSVKPSMVDYMDNYQLPMATHNTIGGVIYGNSLTTRNGKTEISVNGIVNRNNNYYVAANNFYYPNERSYYPTKTFAAGEVVYFGWEDENRYIRPFATGGNGNIVPFSEYDYNNKKVRYGLKNISNAPVTVSNYGCQYGYFTTLE